MPGLWDTLMSGGKKAAKKGASAAKEFDQRMVESHGGGDTDAQETLLGGAPSEPDSGGVDLGIGPMNGDMADDADRQPEMPGNVMDDIDADADTRWEGGQPDFPGDTDEDRDYNFPDLF